MRQRSLPPINADLVELSYEWTDGFIQVLNGELNLFCCLEKRAIETLRNTLRQRGVLDFQPGVKNKCNPAYKLNYLTVGCKNSPNDAPILKYFDLIIVRTCPAMKIIRYLLNSNNAKILCQKTRRARCLSSLLMAIGTKYYLKKYAERLVGKVFPLGI